MTFIGITLAVIFFIAIAFRPAKASIAGSNNEGNPALPDSVMKIVQKACMDCHADDGNFMAKGKINFSSWDKYDSEKQFNKANAMCKELTKSAMPPKKWRTNNPKDIPTQADVDMVCRWAKSLQK